MNTESKEDGTVIEMVGVSANWIAEDAIAEEIISDSNAGGKEASKSKGYSVVAKDGETEGTGIELTASKPAVAETEVVPLNRSQHTLIDMTLNIKKGQLVAIVGSVGSGKSSFLSALLGEMHLQQGSVRTSGKIAYCDQRAWILNATVEDNILFGAPKDEARFHDAIVAANLEDDFKVLPAGMLTEIGERGINLSGGQKARVALARAVYLDADVYLLDDPLSAVDVSFTTIKLCVQFVSSFYSIYSLMFL